MAFATSSAGTPTIAEEWAGDLGDAAQTESALQVAASGGTTRLGRLLAPMAVQYVVVPLAPAPDPYARDTTYVPSDLLAVLDGQLDLDSVTVNAGVRVYRTPPSARPGRCSRRPPRSRPAATPSPTGSSVASPGAPAVLGDVHGYSDWSGSVDAPGPVYLSAGG